MEQGKVIDKESRISSQIGSTEVIECELFDNDQLHAPKLETKENTLSWKYKTVILFTMLTMPGI